MFEPTRVDDLAAVAAKSGVELPRSTTGRLRCSRELLAHPALRPIADYRSLRHKLSTARSVAKRVVHGRLWPRYVFDESLGRPHAAEVAYMAWPEVLHSIVRADGADWFVMADFEAMELRVLAALSGDKHLKAALDECDFHRETAARMFGGPAEHISPEQRQAAKTLTFAILYGSTASGVAYRLKIDRRRAADFIHRWEKAYPQAVAYICQIKHAALCTGRVRTYHGRERNLEAQRREDRAKAARLAVSHVIQSTAGDLMRLGLIQLWPVIIEMGGRILGTVHDSYLLTIPRAVPIDEILSVIARHAIERSEPGFSLRMKVTLGAFWGDRQQEHLLGERGCQHHIGSPGLKWMREACPN
jgi:hypothetical protein